MWFKEKNTYFWKIECFAYGEINERNFRNPQPWNSRDSGNWSGKFICNMEITIDMIYWTSWNSYTFSPKKFEHVDEHAVQRKTNYHQ